MWLLPIFALSLVFWATAIFGQTVTYDMGGSIKARLEEMQGMSGVVIDGECFSACTLYLGLPETCVTSRAKLGLHSPKTKLSGYIMPLPKDEWESLTQLMSTYYPEKISEWYMAEARHSTDIVTITGEQAVAMGAKACKS